MDSKFTHFVYLEALFQPFPAVALPGTEVAGLDGDTGPIARFVDPAIEQAAIGLEGATSSAGPGCHSKVGEDGVEFFEAGESVGTGDFLDFGGKVVGAFKVIEVALATACGDEPIFPLNGLTSGLGDFFPDVMKTDGRPVRPNGIGDNMNVRMVGVKMSINQVWLPPKSDSFHIVNGDLL